MRQGANEILVFVFTHFYFPNEQFYSAKRYIHVTQEGQDYSLFVLVEAVIPDVISGALGPLTVDQTNLADGAEGKDSPILLSDHT